MNHLNTIFAILKKQIQETIKNKAILLQFIMFPVLTILLSKNTSTNYLPDNFFVSLFIPMYIGMAPLICISTIISEEKENNTLKALMMSNVQPFEYLIGTGFHVIVLCLIGCLIISTQANLRFEQLISFLMFSLLGIVISTLIGATIGMISKNQINASSISIPLMIIFSFSPMLTMLNGKAIKITQFIYTQQIYELVANNSILSLVSKNFISLTSCVFVTLIFFIITYKKIGIYNTNN